MKIFRISIVILLLITFRHVSLSQELIKDFEGNKYTTVKIGDQVWMAENLNSLLDPGGDSIESYCFYDDTNYCNVYGRLYPWSSLNISGKGVQGICPDGWHIPSDEEWTIMIENAGGYDHAGMILKNKEHPDFNIEFGGNYNPDVRIFSYIDEHAYYWTSTKFSNTSAWMRQIGKNNKNINRSTVHIIYAFSVRCVKD